MDNMNLKRTVAANYQPVSINLLFVAKLTEKNVRGHETLTKSFNRNIECFQKVCGNTSKVNKILVMLLKSFTSDLWKNAYASFFRPHLVVALKHKIKV